MLSHDRIWAAIDSLAERNDLSASGLARRAGLDPTAFNKSKRHSADGRPRWPSTESLAKIIEATGATLDDFFGLVSGRPLLDRALPAAPSSVPLLGFAQAGAGGFFDDAGFPVGQGWDLVELPGTAGDGAYALKVQGDSMLPVYRDGDTLVVEPGSRIDKGDRVVVRTRQGEVTAKELVRQTTKLIELRALNPDHPNRVFAPSEIDWMVRIKWASQ